MRTKRLALLCSLFLFIVYSLSFIVPPAHADGEFSTNYDVTYEVDQNGFTRVTQHIELVNKTPNFYAEKFELKIGSTKVKDVVANDNTGKLETEVKFDNDVTTIGIKFNQKVIGTGKNLAWTLEYTSEELATKSGQIWEISIPRLAKSQDIDKYKAVVKVPRTFGPVAYTTPQPKNQTQVAQNQQFEFERDQLYDSGISMSFGTKQVFSFKLDYYLENNNVTALNDEITLPPDNNYQKIVLDKLEPKPNDVVTDGDGNFIAKYRLAAKKSLQVTATGHVEVFSKPFRNINKPLTKSQKEAYIQPQRYWEIDNGPIHDKANELKTPDKIYEFVTNYLKYNDRRLSEVKVERKGAAAAISNPNDAVCTEFTDLFIALARAAGIPAREVEGYAYTQNNRLRPLSLELSQGDILHAWPEYWDDQKGWVQVDPTWGATSGGLNYFEKLDFNHITFVHRGISSTSPSPAGAFKKEGEENKKTVNVEFATDLSNATIAPEVYLNSPTKLISGLPTKIEAVIKNSGTSSIFEGKVNLEANKLSLAQPQNYDVDILPPFASRTFNFRASSTNLLNFEQDVLILSFSEAQITKPITIEPFYKIVFSPLATLLSLVVAFTVVFALFMWRRYHRKRAQR